MPKLKNIFTEGGHPICGGTGKMGCGKETYLGIIIKGIVYCHQCGVKLKKIKKQES